MRWNVLAFLIFCGIVYGEDTDMNDSAHIVASKFTLSQYAVEGMDYVIDYRLYNVGNRVSHTEVTIIVFIRLECKFSAMFFNHFQNKNRIEKSSLHLILQIFVSSCEDEIILDECSICDRLNRRVIICSLDKFFRLPYV